jgi:hypothetical protein
MLSSYTNPWVAVCVAQALLSMPGIQKGAAMVVTTLIVPSLPKSAGGIGEEDDDD